VRAERLLADVHGAHAAFADQLDDLELAEQRAACLRQSKPPLLPNTHPSMNITTVTTKAALLEHRDAIEHLFFASFGQRTLTNFRVGVDNGKFNVAIWANNVFDVTYSQNSINQPRAGIPFAFVIPEIYLGEGRRMGLTAGYRF
jgi:hypothetical protein